MGGGPGGSGGGGGSSSGGRGGGDSFGLTLQDVVKPGSLVKKGQTVAEFDRQYMLQRLDDYRTSVAQTEANLKKLKAEIAVSKQSHNHTIAVAKAQLEKARLDLKSTPVLGAIDSERLRLAAEEAEARYKQLVAEVRHFDIAQKAQLRNAELDTKQMEIEFKRAEANVDKLVTKAPIDGLTVMQSLFRGSEMAQIQAGDQLWPGMMFMQIVDTSSMVINATANQVDIERLKIGAKARVKFDAFPELTLPAHIYSIGAITRPGGMRGQFFKEIPIRLKLDKMDPRVIPDLSVSVDVVLEEEPNVAAVAPLASIFRDASDSRPYVYVKNGEAWERRNVELGLASNVMVTIRSGLKRGDVVALDAPEKKDGSPGA